MAQLASLRAAALDSARPLLLLRAAALPFETLAPLAAGDGLLAALAAWLDAEEALAAAAAALGDRLFAAAGERPGEGEDAAAARARLAAIALRRALHNGRKLAPRALAEAAPRLGPALAADLARHEEARAGLARARAAYEAAFAADLARARRELVALAGRPIFREGIRLVGRALAGRLAELARRDPARWRHDERHAAAKATAYAARFAAKTSPNSVFCGVALARIGEAAAVAGENREARREEILSVAEARKVAACLAADRAAWPAVVPRPNPTLRPDVVPDAGPDAEDGFLTFWRPATPRREGDDEVRSRLRRQPVVDLFLAAAARGTLTAPELLAEVAAESGLAVADLEPFLARLADAGVLLVEIEPPYNARRPLAYLAEAVVAAGCAPPWAAEAAAIERAVDELPALPVAARLPAMDSIAARLDALPHGRPLAADELFRVDVATGLDVAIPAPLLGELRGAVGRYVRLFAAMYPEPVFREGWGRRFLSRFPADEEVPLLDLYHGLFEPEPDPRPSAFPPAPPADAAAVATAERVRGLLAGLARQAAATGAEEVALDDGFFAAAGALPEEPDWAAGVLFQVAASDPAALDAPRCRIVLNAFFGAGIALARFAWLFGSAGEPSPAVVREVARYAAPLAPPGAVVAEVTYNHLGRSANAGLRPAILRHEIELPGDRASLGADAIPLADLVVRWDSAARRFVLRSLSRGAPVVPVISSGVSPEGFISFLVELGRQGLQPLGLFPGFDVPDVLRWPRFTLGRVVLFRRRWIFPPGAAPAIPHDPADAAGFFADVARWRRASGLPRHVFLHTDAEPKPYYADLGSPLSAELLRRTLAPGGERPVPTLHATEMLPGPGELWVGDAAGRYATELLVQMSGRRGAP